MMHDDGLGPHDDTFPRSELPVSPIAQANPDASKMPIKRKRRHEKQVIQTHDALKWQLSFATKHYGSAKIALLHRMEDYNFSPSLLRQVLLGTSILAGTPIGFNAVFRTGLR
jgi:hypothetical protein